MSVSQMLLAVVTPEPRPGCLSGCGREATGEGQGGFADLLASQNPDVLQGQPSSLLEARLPVEEDLSLASDGKTLPDTLELWMEDVLAEPSGPGVVTVGSDSLEGGSLTEGAQRWLEWLDSARNTLNKSDDPALAVSEDESADSIQVSIAGATLNSMPADALKPVAIDPRDALISGVDEGKGKARDLPIELAGKDQQPARAQTLDQQSHNAPLQRTVSVALAADTQIIAAQRMTEPESLLAKRGSAESDAIDGLSKPGTGTLSPGQSPLTARPVTAPPQALGVPFGQPSWGEAMVEKVMWMSSQNLRSVEIRLDPAELGPLEIHIQNRGQDNQVQFLSQNASVREALESQMYRLREMFSQQGMDRVEVTVADNPQRDTSGGQTQGGLDQRGQASRRAGSAGEEGGQSVLTTAAAAQVSSDRLVDYYA